MPLRAPGYGGPKVESTPLPGGRASGYVTPEAAGAEGGKAIASAGFKMYEDELLRQDSVAFLEADRQLSEWENKRLYDPKDGALTKRGKDALAQPDAVSKDYDTFVEQVRNGLTNERQKVAFERTVASRRKDINSTLSRHVFTESRKFEEAETENYIANSTQAAILNFHDSDRVALEMERAKAAVIGFARRNGMGEEYIKQKTAQVVSNTNVGIVDRMLANGQDRVAEEFVKGKKDGAGNVIREAAYLAGDDVGKVEAKLQVSRLEGEGLRGAASIWDKLGPKGDIEPVNADAMMKDAEAKYADDPKLLKAVKQQLHERAQTHNAAQRERKEANGSAVWSAIEAGATLAQVRKMPEYLALPGHERNQIREHIVDRADMLRRRAEGEGDAELYYRLSTEASTPALQDKFLTTNLLEHRAKLGKGYFNHLVEVQTALRKGDTRGAEKLMASEKQQAAMVNEALLSMKLDPTPNEKTSKENIEKIVGFRKAVREAVRTIEINTGKNATDEQVQSVVDGLVIEGVKKKGIIFDDKARVYQLQPGESLTIKADQVPKKERAKIEAALVRNGRRVTDEAVTSLYTAQLMRLRGAPPAGPEKK